jgi:hypothetical protein
MTLRWRTETVFARTVILTGLVIRPVKTADDLVEYKTVDAGGR